MANSDDILRKTTEILSSNAAEKQANKTQLERERRELVAGIGKDLAQVITPALERVMQANQINTDSIRAIIQDIKVEAPVIPPITLPPINVPRPNVTVKAPTVNVPRTVIPEPKEVNFPSSMDVGLNSFNNKKPLPVQMFGVDGKPFSMSMGASGGKADFLTIKDIRTSQNASLIDDSGALKIAGSFSATAGTEYSEGESVASIEGVAMFGDNGEDDANVYPIALASGAISSNSVRVVMATDAVASVNIVSGSASGTEYTDGATASPPDGSVIMGDTGEESGNIFAVAMGSGATSSNSIRVVQASDANSSVNVVSALPAGTNAIGKLAANSGVDIGDVDILGGTVDTVTTVTTVTGITNSLAANIVDSSGVAYSGSNALPTILTGLSNTQIEVSTGGSDSLANSTNELHTAGNMYAFNNTSWDRVRNGEGTAETAMRVIHASDVGLSTATTGNTAHDAADAGNPVKIGFKARTANPTAVAANDRTDAYSDTVGRQIIRPVQVRGLVQTAFAAVITGTEATLLAGVSGVFHDLIYVMAANHSDSAVQVDIRQTTAGTIQMSLDVPANGTTGVSLPVPIPQDHADSSWTVDLGDDTQDCDITGLFSKEI